MGLLKRFSSLNLKARNKVSERPQMVEPLGASSLNGDHVKSWTDPSVGPSFFDDIFMELGQALPDKADDAPIEPMSSTSPVQGDMNPAVESVTTNAPTAKTRLPLILDSDVSGTEDESTDEEEKRTPSRTTERKRHPGLEMDSMLDRMKDRHRQQVQAMRQPGRYRTMISPMISPPRLVTSSSAYQFRPAASRLLPTPPLSTRSSTTSSIPTHLSDDDADDEHDDTTSKNKKKRHIHALKSMKSEPNLAPYYQHMMLQQHQLRMEWERIKLYQYQIQQDYYLQLHHSTWPLY